MTSESVVVTKVRKIDDPMYFNNYYHAHNEYVECECGQTVRNMYRVKHCKSKKHGFLLARKELGKEVKMDEIAVLD